MRSERHMGQMIASLRKAKNLTQQDLATALNVTDKAVSKWERGVAYPDILLIPKLAEILGVTTDTLLSANADTSPDTVSAHLKIVTRKEWMSLAALMFRCVGIVAAAGCLLFNIIDGEHLGSVGSLIILSCSVICLGISSFIDH